MTSSNTLSLAQSLIACPSVTPEDAGCQAILIDRLKKCGFEITPLKFGKVDNFWAQRGSAAPLLVFAGHTDVVPTGPKEAWGTAPFTPTIKDGVLYGRGAADMKSSVAAMVTACERFLAKHSNFSGSIGFLITGDEEGPSIDGTRKVIEYLQSKDIKIHYCIVGEPTSEKNCGDMIKYGRRGSLNATLTIHGKQGHVAYPHLANNPIHPVGKFIDALTKIQWDNGNDHFQPTQLQITNINSGTGAMNVIPGSLVLTFNLRYSPERTQEDIQAQIIDLLKTHQLDYSVDWQDGARPFVTKSGKLMDIAQDAVKTITGITPKLSTSGGTSDARFIAPTGAEVVELGPCNATIHQINECIPIKEIDTISEIYETILTRLMKS